MNQWVTLHPWVYHLKFSLCLLALPEESLGYTLLIDVRPKVQPMFVYTSVMGVPPKVQPMFVSST